MPFLALLGSVAGAAGSVMGGIAGQNQANYQAAIANRNAQVAGMEGATALQAGEEKATEVSLAGAERLGQVKTAMAANNVDINTGSAVNVRASQRGANVLNAATTLWNAQRSEWGLNQQAVGYEAQAAADKAAGKNAMIGGIAGAAGDLIGGIGKFFSPGGSSGGFLGGASPVGPNTPSAVAAASGQGGIGSDYVASADNSIFGL